MKKIFLIILPFLPVSLIYSQILVNPTHRLELLTPDSDEPGKANVKIYSRSDSQFIKIEFPDEIFSTGLITPNDSTMKFQLSQIKRDVLVNIQFIGNGNIHKIVVGEFNAYLDFVHRKDMSGKFRIIALKQNE
jgi:hypothetical protein